MAAPVFMHVRAAVIRYLDIGKCLQAGGIIFSAEFSSGKGEGVCSYAKA